MATTYSAPLIFRVLAKLFPLREHPEFTEIPLEALKQKYRKWDHFCSLAFLVVTPLCVYALHEAFAAYAGSLAAALPRAVYTVLPASPFWYAPASILGGVVACFLVYFLYHLALRERAREYQYYSNRNAGFNASRMFLAAGLLLGAMFLALAFFAAHSSLQLTDDQILLQRLWSLHPERYPYIRITALREVFRPNKENSDFVIEFDDAPRWSTSVEIVFPGPAEKNFLSARARKAIETITEK